MKIMYVLIFIFFLIFSNCRNSNEVIVEKLKSEVDTITTYKIYKTIYHPIQVCFNKDGNLVSIINNANGKCCQTIFFYNNGNIQSKMIMDSLYKVNGRAYYFYEGSGNLSSSYNFVNDIKTGNAVSFFDSTAVYKTTMLYNEEGQMYWRQTLDKNHNVIKEEGKIGN